MSRRGFELGSRGRVPFALVGVLLVVSSALFVSAVDRPQPTPEPAVDLAVERASADARAAVRTAVADAGVQAAANPVLAPATNEWGDVLSSDRTFRDALRVRIYLAARDRLQSVARSHRGVRANATLPAVTTPAELAAAMERVRIERAGPDGTRLRATVSNVSVRATRNRQVVGRERVSFTVVVATPVLAVHDRVERFQRKLKAGVGEPGMGQRLTARLYAVAWARGYAQYGGAPIDNVVANRHVELMANGAVLGVQRSVFGRSDPDGRDALATATATVGLRDFVSSAPIKPGKTAVLRQQLGAATDPSEGAGLPGLTGENTDAPPPNETTNVSVGRTADSLFRLFVDLDAHNETIRSVYSARVRTLAATRQVSGGSPRRPGRPDDPEFGWERLSESTDTTVVGVSNATRGPGVRTPDGFHRLETYVRTVRLRHERRIVWERNGTLNATTRTRTETKRVTVHVVGRHAPTEYAPDRPIESVHDRPGPFGGPNLADVPPAVRADIAAAGGPNGLAARAARGVLNTSADTVRGNWSADLARASYLDLADLRERVANTTVAVPRGEIGTYEANPPARLAERLRARRAALVDAPERYDSVAAKARAAVRGRYLDTVIAALEAQAERRGEREDAFAGALGTVNAPSLSTIRSSYDAARASERGPGGEGASGSERGADRQLSYHVDGAPPYLTLTKVTEGQVAAVEGDDAPTYPLTARNVNYVTIPHGDATDAVLTALMPGGSSRKTRLDTAARALRSANRTLAHRPNATVEERRDRLRREVDTSVGRVRADLAAELADWGVGNSTDERERIVADGLSRWSTLDARALALTNGSAVDPVVRAAARADAEPWTPIERDWRRLSLEDALYASLESKRGKVSGPAVTGATAVVKDAVRKGVKTGVSKAVQKRYNRSIDAIPAGLPMAPPLGNWFVTTNVWSVTVRGQYARFAVETPRRTPGAGDASLNYVRDGGNATLDLDADGESELLGRASRVRFTTRTAVVVVVPSGGTGVGDINGMAIEESAGWAIPGPVNRDRPWTGEKYPLSVDGTHDDCTRDGAWMHRGPPSAGPGLSTGAGPECGDDQSGNGASGDRATGGEPAPGRRDR